MNIPVNIFHGVNSVIKKIEKESQTNPSHQRKQQGE